MYIYICIYIYIYIYIYEIYIYIYDIYIYDIYVYIYIYICICICMKIKFEFSIVILSFLCFLCCITDIKIVQIDACQGFIKIHSVLYHLIENQNANSESSIFNIQNISLDKYSHCNIDDVTIQGQKGESLRKMPRKKLHSFPEVH